MMKQSEILLVAAFCVLLYGASFFFFRAHPSSSACLRFFVPEREASFFELEDYPNPALLDITGTTSPEVHDEFSTSTAHITSKQFVADGVPSATSSERSLRIPIMIYHSVRPHIPHESALQDAYDVTPELLDHELTYAEKHGFTTITFADVREAIANGKPLPPKPIIYSFDDGWENQYRYAYPILLKHHAKGTFYIYTNPISHMKPHFLSWAQVVEMDKAGMEIGGHSRTHPFLTKFVDDTALDNEIAKPKKVIEAELGHAIDTFAYPFGYYNARVVAATRRAGYLTARGVFKGVWIDPAHRYEIRGALATDDIHDFVKYVNMN